MKNKENINTLLSIIYVCIKVGALIMVTLMLWKK